MKANLQVVIKGGPGSGHRGHAGRPGKRGGSLPGKSGSGGAYAPGTSGKGGRDPNADKFLSGRYKMGWESISIGSREIIEGDVILDLGGRSGVELREVQRALDLWSETSNDSDIRALSMQEAAAEELGIELSNWQKENLAKVGQWNARPALVRPEERAVIRAMYNSTQERFKDMGHSPDDTITLYRGHNYHEGISASGVVNYRGNAIESWTASSSVAEQFGLFKENAVVLSMEVPIRNIVSSARTGFGVLREGEFVIIGSVPGQRVHALIEADW